MLLEFLEGTAECFHGRPSQSDIDQVKKLIQDGVMTWHAKAFDLLPEIASPFLYEYSLNLSRKLDTMFGKETKIAGIHTDVPGISRSGLCDALFFLHLTIK